MENRFFSLIVVPDSGGDVRTGSFSLKLILVSLASLSIVFLTCLFFIIGYHIKLSQEKSYKRAVSVHKKLLEKVEESQKLYRTLSEHLAKIQHNDKAFRNFNRMRVLDSEMYKAGIGGHVIVNSSDYETLGDDLRVELEELDYGITTLGHRITVLDSSFAEIQKAIELNKDIYDNTPTILPTHSVRITSYFGWRYHPVTKKRNYHKAVDIAGYRGMKIFATADGVVVSAKNTWGPLGKCIKIKHKYGYETLYGHLDKILVKAGQRVKKHDVIGTMGRSGTTTGVHLHYGISLNGKPQNPLDYF